MPAMHAVTALMRRAGRSLLSAITKIARASGAIAGRLLVGVFGRWKWEAPGWLAWMDRRARSGWRFSTANPKRASAAAALLVAAGAGYAWYASRPKPHYVAYRVHSPALTTYNDSGIPRIKSMAIAFSESAAPLKQLKKAVTAGIELSPGRGRHLVLDDRQGAAVHAEGRLAGRRRVLGAVGARRACSPTQVRLEDYTLHVQEPAVRRADQREPVLPGSRAIPNLKKLVATVTFSHPVDTEQFEPRVSLAVAKDAEYLGLTPDSRHFTVAYDKFKLVRLRPFGGAGACRATTRR